MKGEKHLETCVTNHALIKLTIIHSLQRQGSSWHALVVRPYAGANEEHEESAKVAPSAEAISRAETTPSTKAKPNDEITYVVETTTSSKRKKNAGSNRSRVDTPPMNGR